MRKTDLQEAGRTDLQKRRVRLLNTYVDNITMEEAVAHIEKLARTGHNAYVVTPNVDHIVRLERDEYFRQIYSDADLILTDGKPLIWISKWMGEPIKEKVSGADLFPRVCAMAAGKGYRVALLGAKEGAAARAAENLVQKYPGLRVTGIYSPPLGFEKSPEEREKVYSFIRLAEPDILCIGLGTPMQEKFFFKARKKIQVPVVLHIGAAIDFEAGVVQRAPGWMQDVGLEWLYRVLREPGRLFKRYFIDDMAVFGLCWKYRKKAERGYHGKKV